jgi:hypothetical protein
MKTINIRLKRHGCGNYFDILGLPDNYAGVMNGASVTIDEYKPNRECYIKADKRVVNYKNAEKINNGFVPKAAARQIERFITKAVGVPCELDQHIESYFVGSKFSSVKEWEDRQRKDRDIVKTSSGEVDITDMTLSEAVTSGMTASAALQYPVLEYDDMLSEAAKICPNGSFSHYCNLAHFRKSAKSPREVSSVHTPEEIAELLS